MPTETATVRTRDGRTALVQAEIRRDGATRRMVMAGSAVLAALLISLPAYAFPGIHCILLIPLYGVAAAVAFYLMGRVAVVAGIEGSCPSCDGGFQSDEGGPLGSEALWIRCPICETPLELVPEEPQ